MFPAYTDNTLAFAVLQKTNELSLNKQQLNPSFIQVYIAYTTAQKGMAIGIVCAPFPPNAFILVLFIFC